ncbi:MAG: FHA domain-containing protein [Phycisphaeraceae bacterium]|nr:FHA domain-containing protein [Phycisphaeraceae bacterium]
METSLILVNRDGTQREIPLKKARFIVGRQADCQIRLPDPGVSRQHCEIQIDAAKPIIKDLGSSNGTYVNRRRVSQTELAAGDTLSIGPFVFVFRVDGEPSNIDVEEVLEDAVGIAAPGNAPHSAQNHADEPAAPPAGQEPPTRIPDPDDSDEFEFDFLDEDDSPKL